MSDAWDPESICRHEACVIHGIHAKHEIADDDPPPRKRARVHHRPNASAVQLDPASPSPSSKPEPKRPPWMRDDPKGLAGAVMRQTSRFRPTYFTAIHMGVLNDYGECHERTVYRHINKLVERGHLAKVEIPGLKFAAYIRPKARMLRDPEAIREYMLGVVDDNEVGKRRGQAL